MITKKLFDKMPDGREVMAYTITNGDCEATIIELGAILQSFEFKGERMVYGFNKVEHYFENTGYIGATVGRTSNRTKGTKMTLDGYTFTVAANDNGKNHLHGGASGFNQKLWKGEAISDCEVALTYLSPDGEEGYPGNLSVKVTYKLDGNALSIHYEADTDKATYVGMTNHSYFNASRLGSPIFEQELTVNADTYTAVDDDLMPNGEHPDVAGTPFDFREMKKIGRDLGGDVSTYDHNFVLNGKKAVWDGVEYNDAATLKGDLAKIQVLTNKPCIQVYSGYFLAGKNAFYDKVMPAQYISLCLETQFEPDAPSRGESILRPGEKYDYTTIYIFS